VKWSEIEASVRLKYADPEEVAAFSIIAAEGLAPFEAALVQQSFAPGQRILDIGCGGGREAAAMVQYGLGVVAMDLVPAMVQAARSYSIEMGQTITYLVGDVVTPPFHDASFDGVAMLGAIISHVAGRNNRVQALRAVRRALRPGGKLAMTTHNRRCHWKFRLYFACVNRFRRLARYIGLESCLGDNDRWSTRISKASSRRPVFFHMYDLDEAREDLREAGFEVLDARARAEFEAGCVDLALRERDYVLGFIAKRPEA
jgi:SAM-dependent methyltransferase